MCPGYEVAKSGRPSVGSQTPRRSMTNSVGQTYEAAIARGHSRLVRSPRASLQASWNAAVRGAQPRHTASEIGGGLEAVSGPDQATMIPPSPEFLRNFAPVHVGPPPMCFTRTDSTRKEAHALLRTKGKQIGVSRDLSSCHDVTCPWAPGPAALRLGVRARFGTPCHALRA